MFVFTGNFDAFKSNHQRHALTSLLRRGLEARCDDVVVLLQLVVKAVSPPQLADQFGRLQTAAVLDLLDY